MKDILVVINGPAYGSDAGRDDTSGRVFLMADGYYALDRMLTSFSRKGGSIACCGTCLNARGMTEDRLIPQGTRSTMDELAGWVVTADQTLTF